MIAGLTAEFIVGEFGPIALLLIYLYLRDRKMENAILTLAEQTQGVDPKRVREQLEVGLRGD
ncbi:hypothetical protein EXE53_16730 [Halorubrum sp. SD626R]|uniref:hypothetical protein n=1 Tax=Halorubrum sp. SD626R TaxID=1419722 RepID=UPI0010F5827F|nr:hypothetical protein [Halorubrum sp. SD626R]TKX79273.1 hypothetical protein EXE53_16730 [Halorubrum sp. SD626R]